MRASSLAAVAGVLAVVAAACVVAIDEPLAGWVGQFEVWRGWADGIHALEYPGGLEPWIWDSTVVVAVGVVVALARRRGARAWIVVAGTHLLSRNVVMWTKFGTGRLRPFEWLGHGGSMWLRDGSSFPSGHVAWFASLAVPIAVFVPRARVPLAAAIAFTIVAKVAVGAHFASDTIASLALACACTALWLHVTRRLRDGSPPPASPR